MFDNFPQDIRERIVRIEIDLRFIAQLEMSRDQAMGFRQTINLSMSKLYRKNGLRSLSAYDMRAKYAENGR